MKIGKIEYMIVLVILAAIVASCDRNHKPEMLMTIDLTQNVPQREIVIQDFANVEYVALETNDEFLLNNSLPMFINDEIIVITESRSGDIMFFDRASGKTLSKFNRKGRSDKEYTSIGTLAVDYQGNEIFIWKYSNRSILVYDLNGNFKRSLDMTGREIGSLYNYDRDNLIGYDRSKVNEAQPCVLIDKKDGSITHEFFIPVTDDIVDFTVREGEHTTMGYMSAELVKTHNGYAVGRPSIDTIYTISPTRNTIAPSLVREPAVLAVNPRTLLYPVIENDKMFFFSTQEIDYDFKTNRGFFSQVLALDKRSGECFVPKVTDRNYAGWEGNIGGGGDYPSGMVCFLVPALQLTDAKNSERLSDELDVLSSSLSEESNPVLIMATIN